EVFPISALEGNNVEFLLRALKSYLPEGPQYYPTDQITDHPERFIMTELIREKVLQLTREEVPHSIAVILENIERRKNNTLYMQAVMVTERPTQKGILIGEQGKMLKQLGKKACEDIDALLGTKVFLQLWVKVAIDRRKRENQLRDLGFR